MLILLLQINALTGIIFFHFPHPQAGGQYVWGGRVCLATRQQESLNADPYDPSGLSSGMAAVVASTVESEILCFTLFPTIK